MWWGCSSSDDSNNDYCSNNQFGEDDETYELRSNNADIVCKNSIIALFLLQKAIKIFYVIRFYYSPETVGWQVQPCHWITLSLD